MRHAISKRMLSMAGANLMVVKEILGHENIRTTQRYIDIDEKATRAALETVKLPKLDAA
ncbi:MAG: tyrosine-type recombinase/integrase [Pseudomonadota bacterium]|nr:tyrosine-type recombinase/integrase [Pseudomonadota bacterium]